MPGRAGMSWRVDVAKCALFQARTVGCVLRLKMELETASKGMPLLEGSVVRALRGTVRQCCGVVRMVESGRDLWSLCQRMLDFPPP